MRVFAKNVEKFKNPSTLKRVNARFAGNITIDISSD